MLSDERRDDRASVGVSLLAMAVFFSNDDGN
jgi:hypothetical protein